MVEAHHHHGTSSQKAAVVDALSRLLADTFVLYLKTHGFHWNVVGPRFYELHKLFEDQYNALWDSLDALAERLRALGARAPASFAEYARLASVAEESRDLPAHDMIRQLLEANRALSHAAQHLVEIAETAEDAGTADLATIRSEAHDKAAWMLASLLQAEH